MPGLEENQNQAQPEEGLYSINLERIHEKNGYYDGKLFYSHGRVTYTFICDDEVIALHLDRQKQALFFKGHKITSLQCHPQLQNFLNQFKKCLGENPQTKGFVKVYEAIVSSLW